MKNEIRVGVTSGIRGYFAVMYDDNGPIQTGLTFKDFKGALQYAIEWAKADGVSCDYVNERKNES